MTNQEILERAIQKAIEGGWENSMQWTAEFWTSTDFEECAHYPIIFNHDFARALWGDVHRRWVPARTKTMPTTGTTYTQPGHYQRVLTKSKLPAWQFNLQQMVIADDPITYLGDHLDGA